MEQQISNEMLQQIQQNVVNEATGSSYEEEGN